MGWFAPKISVPASASSKIDDVLASCLKVIGWVVGGGLKDFSVSPSPLWVNLGFELGWTGLGLGLVGLGTRGTRVWD